MTRGVVSDVVTRTGRDVFLIFFPFPFFVCRQLGGEINVLEVYERFTFRIGNIVVNLFTDAVRSNLNADGVCFYES